LLGAAAVVLLPREEEPQIKVPMVDVMVAMPGSSAKEDRGTRHAADGKAALGDPRRRIHLQHLTRQREPRHRALQSRRRPERSLVKLTEKLRSNFDRIPMGVSDALIKPKSIDDVPILALTFHSARYDHLTLRRWPRRSMNPSNKCRSWPKRR
jgi:hypothetical protein